MPTGLEWNQHRLNTRSLCPSGTALAGDVWSTKDGGTKGEAVYHYATWPAEYLVIGLCKRLPYKIPTSGPLVGAVAVGPLGGGCNGEQSAVMTTATEPYFASFPVSTPPPPPQFHTDKTNPSTGQPKETRRQ